MARKKLLGNEKGSSTQVNPTVDSPGGNVNKSKPATPSNVQLNPTAAAKAGHTPSKSGASRIASKGQSPTRTYAATHSEGTKGSSGKKLVARKNKVGAPLAAKSEPLKPNVNPSKKAVKVRGGGPSEHGDKTHNFSSPSDFSIPKKKTPMTTSRLKKLGY